jgi:hypothetical protein
VVANSGLLSGLDNHDVQTHRLPEGAGSQYTRPDHSQPESLHCSGPGEAVWGVPSMPVLNNWVYG